MPFNFTGLMKRKELVRAFSKLFQLYGEKGWNVLTTCNVILQSNNAETFSVYYGQSYGVLAERQASLRRLVSVNSFGDLGKIELDHSQEDFSDIFFLTHHDSSVSVHSVINIVFLITRFLTDLETQAVSIKQKRYF